MGSCKGFLLVWGLSIYPDLYLWNPSTSVHKPLPLSPLLLPTLYGFGYDPSTDDYLVVLASGKTSQVGVTRFEFFSLRANSWERIEGTHLPYINHHDVPRVGSLFNGAIHWLANNNDDVDVIVAFDLVERSFSEISLPYDSDWNFSWCDLWVHGGFLGLYLRYTDTAEIWVMEEYHVPSSWTKSIVVPLDFPNQYFSPISSTKNGDILGKGGRTTLVKCNANGELLEYRSYPLRSDTHKAWITHFDAGIQAAMYTETLLSLPSGSGHAECE